MKTLIEVQDAYATKLNNARRKAVGFKQRAAVRLIEGKAWKAGLRQLETLGFTHDQAINALRDARDVADLEYAAELEVKCQAFALCGQPATTVLERSIFGAVPACARCKARLEGK